MHSTINALKQAPKGQHSKRKPIMEKLEPRPNRRPHRPTTDHHFVPTSSERPISQRACGVILIKNDLVYPLTSSGQTHANKT